MKRPRRIYKALVTGGAGFIGSHLCEELLENGFSVDVVDDLATSSKQNLVYVQDKKGFRFFKGSILDQALMKRLIRDCDVVYHLAAAVGVKYILDHPLGSILTNMEGAQVVLSLASKFRKKIIVASTSEIYGKHLCVPIDENDDRILGSTNISRWSYADAKAMDEFLALAYAQERKLPVVIVRFFNTVGPRQVGRYGMVLPRFIHAALHQEPIVVYGDGSQIRCFAYVKDVVRAVVELSQESRAEGGIFNVGNDQPISIVELARKVKAKTSSSSEIRFIPYDQAYGVHAEDFEEIECRIPNITKIKQLINYSPRFDIDSIIEHTVAYFMTEGKKNKHV